MPIDIDELEKNKESIEQDCINSFVTDDNTAHKAVHWNWRSPSIHKRH
jgi:hypothetical protein